MSWQIKSLAAQLQIVVIEDTTADRNSLTSQGKNNLAILFSFVCLAQRFINIVNNTMMSFKLNNGPWHCKTKHVLPHSSLLERTFDKLGRRIKSGHQIVPDLTSKMHSELQRVQNQLKHRYVDSMSQRSAAVHMEMWR